MTAKDAVRAAAVNLLVFAGLVGAVELAASLFVQRGWDDFVSSYRLNHAWPASSLRRHAEWAGRNPDFPRPYTHRYNAQGWVGERDVARTKPPGVFRIFYVGDSFTEGTAPMEESVPCRVELGLNARARGQGRRAEVVNTGTSSYSPSIYYVLVRYVLMDYDPDLVVVNVDMTDVDDDWLYSSTMVRDQQGDPWAVPPRDLSSAPLIAVAEGYARPSAWLRLQLFLLRHSYAYNLIWRNRTRKPWGRGGGWDGAPVARSRFGWCREPWDEATAHDVGRTFDLIRRLARFCRSRGVGLMLTAVPHYEQYAGQDDGAGPARWSSRPHYELAKLSRELGVPYLNSFEKLRPSVRGTPRTRYYYDGDMHFNPRGYGLWAQAHLGFLTDRANRLLPDGFSR